MKSNKKILFLALGVLTLLTTGCTYSVTMAHTEGVASDVVDETQSADAKVDPQVNIPASIVP